MNVLWPWLLTLLLIVPLLVAAYVLILRRRRRFVVRYSSLSLVRAAAPRHSWLRRHGPFALFLAALASLIAALSRPVTFASVPTNQTAVLLAIDVSRSMLQDDIPPSRIEAAQAAALSFIQRQKASTRIGIVAFAGFAELVQPPTTDQEALEAAVQSLTTGRGTAIGSGILKAIDVIAEADPSVAPSVAAGSNDPAPPPVPRGVFAPDIIVVLTDGVTTTGPSPLSAAQQAADRGVRVYTIGFGTAAGSANFGGPRFGGPDLPGGGGFRRGIDDETLKQVAALTGGDYHSAESAAELQTIFQNLPTNLIVRTEATEVSAWFTALGALLAAAAVILALRWNPLV